MSPVDQQAHQRDGVDKLADAIDRDMYHSGVSEGTASARLINAAPIPYCDFGGICARAHGAQCAALCRRMRGEA